MARLDSWLRFLIYGLSGTLISLSVFGAWLHYSPVPFWDMWDGGIRLLLNFPEQPDLVLSQHNEHRLVLTRLTVLADYYLFGGRHVFMIAVNYLCVFLTWFILHRCLLSINHGSDTSRRDIRLMSVIMGAWLVSWVQHVNLVWGFQNQVFFAQLFPLLAFLSLSKSAVVPRGSNFWFVAALCFGVMSAGTMANGALALALMSAWALVLRLPIWKVGLLTIAAGSVLAMYVSDYSSPSNHSTVFETVLQHPIAVLQFVLEYLGNPAAQIVGPRPPGIWLVTLLGMIMMVAAMVLTFGLIQRRSPSAVIPGLVLYLVYVGATAFLTAGGRVFVVEFLSLSPRYTTPMLVAWAALACIISPVIFRLLSGPMAKSTGLLVFSAFALTALFVPIIRTWVPPSGYSHDRAMAALALELQAHDRAQVGTIYPYGPAIYKTAMQSSSEKIGVFGRPPLKDSRARLNTDWNGEGLEDCQADLETTQSLPDDEKMSRIEGFILSPQSNGMTRVYLIDSTDRVIGIGLTGRRSETLSSEIGPNVKNAGFTGYALSNRLDNLAVIATETCKARVDGAN